MEMTPTSGTTAESDAALDRRRQLELWKAKKEAEKAAKAQPGAGSKRNSIMGKDSLSASLSRTFGTPVTNKDAGKGPHEKSGSSAGPVSAAKRERPSEAATAASRLATPRSTSADVSKSSSSSVKTSTQHPLRPPSGVARASVTTPRAASASAGAKLNAAQRTVTAKTSASISNPVTKASRAPSSVPAASNVTRNPPGRQPPQRGQRLAATSKRAAIPSRHTEKGPGRPASAKSTRVSGKGSDDKEDGGNECADENEDLLARVVGDEAGNAMAAESGHEHRWEEEQVEEGVEDGKGGEEEDLMSYLMPVADNSVDDGVEEDEELVQESWTGVTEDGSAAQGMNGSMTEASDCDGEAVHTLQADKADEASEVMSDTVGQEPVVVTPHMRKVLASSDIFTPESARKPSPTSSAAHVDAQAGNEGLSGSLISPCVQQDAEAEKRERKSAAKRRKSSMLAFTLTPGAGPGQEGQLTPVSRAAAKRAIAGAAADAPLLLQSMQSMQHDGGALSSRCPTSPHLMSLANRGLSTLGASSSSSSSSSPVVRPPVPVFNSSQPAVEKEEEGAGAGADYAQAASSSARIATSCAPADKMALGFSGGAPITPGREAGAEADEVSAGGTGTPGSAMRRTRLGATPRRIKSPFPRAPGLAGTAQRVAVVSPSPRKSGKGLVRGIGGAGDEKAGKGMQVSDAERIAMDAVGAGGVVAASSACGRRLWRDEGGVGREASDDDAMAPGTGDEEAEEDAEQGAVGRNIRVEDIEAEGDGHEEEEEEEEEEGRDALVSPQRDTTTPGQMIFTPGGRMRAALSPIPQEGEEEEEAESGGRRSVQAEEDEDVERVIGSPRGQVGYLQPAVSSTPGKEYLEYVVRKTYLGGTPLRQQMAVGEEDAHEGAEAPTTPGGSYITRVPVRATSAQKEEHGSNVILTPVRRSARKQRPHAGGDEDNSVGRQLAECGWAYQPNKNIIYPDEMVDAEEEEGGEAMQQNAELKRKALESPSSSHKADARRRTPRSSAKKSDDADGQDDVTLKRRVLRAKLAEADSPLPPPKRLVP